MEEHLLLCVFCFWTSRYFLPLITLFLSWSWDFPRRLLIGESPSCGSQGGGGGLQQRFSLLLSFLWTNCACSERLPPSAFSSVQSLSYVLLFATPWTHARPPCPSPTPRDYSNSCPLRWWCHPTISSSVVPFSSVQFSCSVVSDSLRPHGLQHTRPLSKWLK